MKKHLQDLDSKYVIIPVEKAAGNRALACQEFYALLLVTWIWILNINNNAYQNLESGF